MNEVKPEPEEESTVVKPNWPAEHLRLRIQPTLTILKSSARTDPTLIGSSQAPNSKADTEAGPSTSPPLLPSGTMTKTSMNLTELTLTTTHLLHSAFSTLAKFTPTQAPSLQNRLEPIGWEGVLDAFALYRSCDSGGNDADATERTIESVRNRIPVVYGPDPSFMRIISVPEDPPLLPHNTNTSALPHRTQPSRTDLSSLLTRYGVSDDSLFNVPVINENSTVQ
ncbi:hypothetical protein V5O48_008157 [Marasmius crinis-equi]|uniref:Uncharacterized protein n=1 Tax=Marasmius crinis-equi TaxID=585013 RepID=A0ABR3FEN6_9AGAR